MNSQEKQWKDIEKQKGDHIRRYDLFFLLKKVQGIYL